MLRGKVIGTYLSRESPAYIYFRQLRCPETPTHVRSVIPIYVPQLPLFL